MIAMWNGVQIWCAARKRNRIDGGAGDALDIELTVNDAARALRVTASPAAGTYVQGAAAPARQAAEDSI